MNIRTVNRQIACAPPTVTGVTASVKNGVATIGNKFSLKPLKVVFGGGFEESMTTAAYRPGDTVYVRSDQEKVEWYTTVYDIDGTKFILVPVEQLRLHSPA